MDQALEELKKAIGAQKCPPAVLARVRQRIAHDRAPVPATWVWFRRAALVLGAVVAVGGLLALWIPSSNPDPPTAQSMQAGGNEIPPGQVVEEAHLSLACIGAALIHASNRSEEILSNEVKLRLLDELERAISSIEP